MPEMDHDTSGLDPDEFAEFDAPVVEEDPDDDAVEVTGPEDVLRGDDPDADEFGIEDDVSEDADDEDEEEDD